jgi:hypothetical protein
MLVPHPKCDLWHQEKTMGSREDHQTDLSQYVAAIARWDGEGGASMSARSNTGVRVPKDLRAERMAERKIRRLIRLPGTTRRFWNVWEPPSLCDGALFRQKSNGNSSNRRLHWPTSRKQPRRKGRSRGFCITIRMTATRNHVGSCCDAEAQLSVDQRQRRLG